MKFTRPIELFFKIVLPRVISYVQEPGEPQYSAILGLAWRVNH